MPGRGFTSATGYRYGFNGKESDDEVKGIKGSQQDYGFRIYDPRLGKFLSVDPLAKKYPELTPYQFGSNRPIDAIDEDGLECSKPDGTPCDPPKLAAEKSTLDQIKEGAEIYKKLHPDFVQPAPVNPGSVSVPKPRADQQMALTVMDGVKEGLAWELPAAVVSKGIKGVMAFRATETAYRTMSYAEHSALVANNGLSHLSGELFVSTEKAYSSSYLGKKGYDIMVTFTLKKGTLKLMSEIGVKDMSLTVQKAGFGHLPPVTKSDWLTKGYNYFKGEGSALNIGLGTNPAIFNKGIIGFH